MYLANICPSALKLSICTSLTYSLLRAKNLQRLCVDFCQPDGIDTVPEANLKCFENLRRLTLNGLWGTARKWEKDICNILLKNSNLVHLTLSFNTEAIQDPDNMQPFFARLCAQYGSKTETPLRLKTLRLGDGIEFPDVKILKKLLEPALLEDIYINNRAPEPRDRDPSNVWLKAPWQLLLSETSTPRLRKVALYQFPQDQWNEAQSLLERASNHNIELRFDRLGRTQPNSPLKYICQDIESIVGLQKVQYPRPAPSDAAYRGIAALDGCIWITHLIFQCGQGCTERTIHSPHDTFSPSLCSFVARLPNLEAVWVPSLRRREYYGAFTRKEQFKEATDLVQHASGKLRYVRFGDRAWRVQRPRGGTKRRDGHGSGFSKHRHPPVLEPLDSWEDEMECPSFFHVTKPMEWCEVTNHVEWRET